MVGSAKKWGGKTWEEGLAAIEFRIFPANSARKKNGRERRRARTFSVSICWVIQLARVLEPKP